MTKAIAIGLAAALLGTSSAAGATRSTTVIKLFSKDGTVRLVDTTPPKGASAGDYISASSSLRNAVAQFGKPRGALVGSDRGRLDLLTPTTSGARVVATLPGGSIAYGGGWKNGADRQVLRVVGGTGRFAKATGTCVVTRAPRNPYGADSLNVFTLQLP